MQDGMGVIVVCILLGAFLSRKSKRQMIRVCILAALFAAVGQWWGGHSVIDAMFIVQLSVGILIVIAAYLMSREAMYWLRNK